MSKKQALKWAAFIGLLTALVTLLTVALALYQQLQVSRQQERDRQAEWERQQRETEAQRRAAVARARMRLCDEHAARREAIEARFSSLMDSHGTMMNAVRDCSRQPDPDNRGACLATVCIGAAVWTGGTSNCVESVADGAALKADIERENGASAQDNCPVPTSAITAFFD